ncbi:hypothetical protein CTI12_AA475500 [Artemisia annua]|nr:hypothetical protein CTI12_AA475500 [Artemisia annua]
MTTNTYIMSLVCQQLQEIRSSFDPHIPPVHKTLLDELKGYKVGIPISGLPSFGNYLGVKGIKKVVAEMVKKGLLLYFKGPECEETYVMSARAVAVRRIIYLKNDVEELLNRHGGKIAFKSFEVLYKRQFHFPINYEFYALTDLDHLCQVLKDILVVEVANPSGAKVIKALEVANPSGAKVIKEAVAVKIYNLRKRKRNE